MRTKNKILSGLVISALLTTGLFAMNNEKKLESNSSSCMIKKDGKNKSKHQKGESIFHIFKQLNLSEKQEFEIKKIIDENRQNMQTINDAFSNNSFDKDKYVKIMSEKRDNMLKSKANVIEKSYAILTPKQKEQFKVLIDLKKEKMSQRFEEKIKG